MSGVRDSHNPSDCLVLTRSDNRRVSGFGTSTLRPNPRYARTSDTHQTLGDIGLFKKEVSLKCIK